MTTTRPLSLQDPTLRQEPAGTTLSGHVDGVEIYFRTDSDLGLVSGAEPFLCAMLVPAMEQARDIVIPEGFTASAEFLANLDRLQDIYAVWYPGFRKVGI